MPKYDWAWAAGLFDGEGCILIHKTGSKTYPAFHLYLVVSMCHRDCVRKFASITGAGYQKQSRRTTKGRLVWRARIGGSRAGSVLKKLYPFLVAKKKEAKIALQFHDETEKRRKNRYTPKEVARCLKAKKKLTKARMTIR